MKRGALGPLLAPVEKQLAQLKADSVNDRLWAHDPTLWTNDPAGQAEVKIRLGWLDLPNTSRELAKKVTVFAQEVKAAGIKKTLLLGMGGSSLGPEVMSLTFNLKPGTFAILDSTDPAQVAEAAKNFPPEETLYIVASKSGGTAETMSAFYYFWSKVVEMGVISWRLPILILIWRSSPKKTVSVKSFSLTQLLVGVTLH